MRTHFIEGSPMKEEMGVATDAEYDADDEDSMTANDRFGSRADAGSPPQLLSLQRK